MSCTFLSLKVQLIFADVVLPAFRLQKVQLEITNLFDGKRPVIHKQIVILALRIIPTLDKSRHRLTARRIAPQPHTIHVNDGHRTLLLLSTFPAHADRTGIIRRVHPAVFLMPAKLAFPKENNLALTIPLKPGTFPHDQSPTLLTI